MQKEGDDKMRYAKKRIAMTSITYAMKAKEILDMLGYRCEVERMPKNVGSGCGYSIVVADDPEVIVSALKRRGISVKGIYDYK